MARQNAMTSYGSPKPKPEPLHGFLDESSMVRGDSVHAPGTTATAKAGGGKPSFSGIPSVISMGGGFSPNNTTAGGTALKHSRTEPSLLSAAQEGEDSMKLQRPSASPSLLNDTQPKQTWGQWAYSGLSWVGSKLPFPARIFNVFFYAMVVTTVFVLLAIQRANGSMPWAITYGATSAIFNWPMAIAFNEKLIKFFQGLMAKPLPYKLSFAAGLLMAVETMIAGLAVAQEGVNKVGKDLPPSLSFLIYYGIVTYLINTFATRTVGATNFLYGTYNDICEWVNKVFLGGSAFYNLADDLKRYGDQVKDEMILGADSQDTFASLFYKKLTEKQLSPSKTVLERLTQVLNFAAVNLPRALAFFLLPMWLGLAQNGWKSTGNLFGKPALADSDALVYTAALSSWLFYMRGSGMFAPNTVRFMGAASDRLKALFENVSPAFANGARYLALGAGFGVIVFTSGCSGSGFAVVMHDQLHPDNATRPYQGFGSSAEKLFTVVPFEWAFKHLIAPMGGYSALAASGIFINGGSFMEFVADCWKIQDDTGCTFMQACKKKMFGIEPPARSVFEEVGDNDHTAVTVEADRHIESPRERERAAFDGLTVVRSDDETSPLFPSRDQASRLEPVAVDVAPQSVRPNTFSVWKKTVLNAVEKREFHEVGASAYAIETERSQWAGESSCFFGRKKKDRAEPDYLARPINVLPDDVSRQQHYGSIVAVK